MHTNQLSVLFSMPKEEVEAFLGYFTVLLQFKLTIKSRCLLY